MSNAATTAMAIRAHGGTAGVRTTEGQFKLNGSDGVSKTTVTFASEKEL